MREVLIVLGILGVVFIGDEVGFLVQPWAPWWIGQKNTDVATMPIGGTTDPVSIAPVAPVIGGAHVTDEERYALALAVGFTREQAIIATALSIAEDGSGDPSAVSRPNFDHSVDNGLWQINSGHIGQCGITSQQWLFDPMNNARAAFCVAGPHMNWCAWSTYEMSCGVGHNGSYRAFLACAQAIADGGTCKR